jgi:hypothetical protein
MKNKKSENEYLDTDAYNYSKSTLIRQLDIVISIRFSILEIKFLTISMLK